jgi:hypothetical protein
MELLQLKASDWVAIFSGVIALLALITTLWQAHLTREHNFLSSRPVIDIDAEAIPERRIAIIMRNCGPGPAIVRESSVTFRKTKYSLNSIREFESFVNALIKAGLPTSDITLGVLSDKAVIAPGSEHALLMVDALEKRAQIASKFRELTHDCQIAVSYESLYSKAYTAVFDNPVVNCA